MPRVYPPKKQKRLIKIKGLKKLDKLSLKKYNLQGGGFARRTEMMEKLANQEERRICEMLSRSFTTHYTNLIDLNELRKKYGKKLKPQKQLEIENMIRRFAELAYAKYAAGAKEHKDDLTVEVARKELKGEAIDLLIYLFKAGLL